MSVHNAEGVKPNRAKLANAGQLNRPERIILLTIVGSGALFDLFGLLTTSEPDPIRSVLSIVTTLTFALYVWLSPAIATSIMGVAIAISFFAGSATPALVVAAVAAALVLRLGSVPVIIGYLGGFLVANALFLYGVGTGESENEPGNVALALIVATVAGGVGFALRAAHTRGERLQLELAEQAERERAAVLAERQWIAGELHDSIAHHLTVVAMHVQLLDDDRARPGSQEAIRTAARKALSDLRFVIELAEDGPRGTGVPSGDLAAAIDEASEEFRATGLQVASSGDPSDENIPRGAEIILARIVRESSTNILKYAGAGEVHIGVEVSTDSVVLSIRSPLPVTPRRDMPSTGTGLNRMAERVLGVRGEFHAGEVDGDWLVEVRLPLVTGSVGASADS